MRLLIACSFISAASACLAGNVPSEVIDKAETLQDLEFGWPEEFEAVEFNNTMIQTARDFNDCLKISGDKNDRDHDRCDKNNGGESCHEKADRQFEDSKNRCERIGHSDNVKGAVDAVSKPANKTENKRHKLSTGDRLPGAFYHKN